MTAPDGTQVVDTEGPATYDEPAYGSSLFAALLPGRPLGAEAKASP
jgi:hypothetical protein